jgi:tetratricopeptide (TPR) repeat protein
MKLGQGDFAAAQALVDQLGEIADAYGYGFADTNHDAMIMLLRLEQRAGGEALAAAERYQSARHEEPLKVLGLGAKAKAQILGGDLDGAVASLAAAERIVRRSREVPPWHLSSYAAARLRIALTALETAGPQAPAALRRQARQGVRYAVGVARKAAIQRTEIYQLCGSIYWRLGQARPAQTWWRRSLATGMRMGAQPELARTYAALSRCLTDGTRLDGLDAEACRERALEGFAALGLSAEHGELVRDGAHGAIAATGS